MEKIRNKLFKYANLDYKNFSEKIMPDSSNMLGVKMPLLHKIAKEIYKTEDWKSFLKETPCYWEELMLQAFVTGEIKAEPEKILHYVENFVPKIDSWSVCDGFCSVLKFTKCNKHLVWDFIQKYSNSPNEYEKRFFYVMLLNYFIDDDYVDKCLEYIDNFVDERYYAKMGTAWALSIIFIKYPEKTFAYLKNSKLEKWTYNKSIQKICESLRVDKETKRSLKMMKK